MTVDAAKKRKRRLASDEAHAWARNLRLHNPLGKSVLRAIALYSDDRGLCTAGLPTLAEDCDVSIDTVRSRVRFLEKVGAVVCMPRWRDANGIENAEGRGKRTTDEIRLLIEADADTIEARALGQEPADDGSSDDGFSPSQQQGLNEGDENVSPRPALGQPFDSGKGLISEPEPEVLPQPPPGVSVEIEGWKEFQEDSSEPILRQSMAQQVWQALTADERTQARQAARGYVAWRKAQRKPPNVLGAHLFLKERDAWPRFAAYAPEVSAASPSGFEPDSAEGRAITALYALARSSPLQIGNRVSYRGEITPQLMALAEAGSHSSWKWIEERQQIAAWSHFVHEHTGRRWQIVNSRGIGDNERHGIYAPWDWPPRKDGSLSPTGPPDTLMSDQDLQEGFK